MIPVPNIEIVPGLIEAYEATGGAVRIIGDVFCSDNPAAMLALAAVYDPMPFCVEDRLEAAASARWDATIRGTTINGLTVGTDSHALAMLNSLVAAVAAGAEGPFNFKHQGNGWQQIAAADVPTLMDGVNNYIQACFDREKELHDQVMAAATWQDVMAVDATTGWPA